MAIDQWVVKAIYVWAKKTERVSEDGERREIRREFFPTMFSVLQIFLILKLLHLHLCLSFECLYIDWQTRHTPPYKVTLCLLPTSCTCILYMTLGWKMWSEISLCMLVCLDVFVCVIVRIHVWDVKMIQSAIWLCEDSLHKHTRHAEDVVILRLIVCISDVSNHKQTRAGFTLPLSLSFSAFSSDCTNCPIVLLLLQPHSPSIVLCSRG